MKIFSRLLRRSPPIQEHRKGVPRDQWWLADKLKFIEKCLDISDQMNNRRFLSLNERMDFMQTALDSYNDAFATLSAKIDEFLARLPAEGLPAAKVAEMATQLRALADKFNV